MPIPVRDLDSHVIKEFMGRHKWDYISSAIFAQLIMCAQSVPKTQTCTVIKAWFHVQLLHAILVQFWQSAVGKPAVNAACYMQKLHMKLCLK